MTNKKSALPLSAGRLPEEILHYGILPRIPFKALARLKFVCKTWRRLISDDLLFANEQSRHGPPISSFMVILNTESLRFLPTNTSDDSFKISYIDGGPNMAVDISSADGLFLLLQQLFNTFYFLYVCNPVTKQGYIVPGISGYRICWHAGLAFDLKRRPVATESHLRENTRFGRSDHSRSSPRKPESGWFQIKNSR